MEHVGYIFEILVDVSKPHHEIFARALERLNVPAAQAVYVGDLLDVAGARRAGMRPVWRRDLNFKGLVEADAVIVELDDLLTLVGAEEQGPA
jgi:putative hydrolase of the HAD superfamily